MHVNGRAQRPARSVTFRSTNGLTMYTAVDWEDPASGDLRSSCNCPGWTIWRDKSKPRTCAHVVALVADNFNGLDVVANQAIHSAAEALEFAPTIKDSETLRSLQF